MDRKFRQARREAGLPEKLVLYCGRHDYGTRVLQGTGNLAVVMRAMGHGSPSTAMKYEDLRRVSSSLCGSIWSQNFSYEAFGNITKSGSSAFAPLYSSTTNQFTSTGVSVSYDANGNLLTDNLNSYTWDKNWGNMLTVTTGSTTVTATYDALGRMVENNAGATFTEFV